MTGRAAGLKNLVTCDQAFEWVRPMKPSPIIATLISRIGRLLAGSRQIAREGRPFAARSSIDRQVSGPRPWAGGDHPPRCSPI